LRRIEMNKKARAMVRAFQFIFTLAAFFGGIIQNVAAQEIVYSSNRNGTYDIWVMNSDQSNDENLSIKSHDPSGQFSEGVPGWSPDGNKIVFLSDKSGCQNVWVMDADGQNDYNLTQINRAEQGPSWGPDGTKIYFSRNMEYSHPEGICDSCRYWEIYEYDLTNNTETRLTSNSYRERFPIVSPNGNQIVYSKAEWPNDCCGPLDIWIMNSDGGNQSLLFGYSDGKYETALDWGNVNNRILIRKQFDCANSSCNEIAHLDPNGPESIFRVTYDSYSDAPAAFSPDGQKILFTSNRSGNNDIWIIDTNGATSPIQLTFDSSSESAGDWKQYYPDDHPLISLLSPNGGETWQKGTERTIAWSQENLTGNVIIDLYKGITNIENIGTFSASDKSYRWLVPYKLKSGNYLKSGNDYKIKIYGGGIEDYSDRTFEIQDYQRKEPFVYRGMSLTDWFSDGTPYSNHDYVRESLDRLKELNVNAVAINVFLYQDGYCTTEIVERIEKEGGPWETADPDDIEYVIEQCQMPQRNMKVILKVNINPIVPDKNNPGKYTVGDRGKIGEGEDPENCPDFPFETWFSNYKTKMKDFARFAYEK